LGAFLVIESRASADARGVKRLARLTAVASDRSRRKPGDIEAALTRLWARVAGGVEGSQAALISGATGAEPATAEERAFLGHHRDIAVRATGTYLGHGFEPQFPMNVALAALALNRGKLFPPGDDSGVERAMDGPLKQVVVTGVGHWRGEGLALIEAP
jgi:3-oxoacyl-[acyl-carrier-protein] synthase II